MALETPVYDYTTAGFDKFFNRSVEDTPQVNLDTSTPAPLATRFDSQQVSGMLGDSFSVGNVSINKDSITMSDGNNIRMLIGEDPQGF